MRIADVCTRIPVTIRAAQTVLEAAKRMREGHVGSLVVVDRDGDGVPVGMITDRDIAVSVIARELDPSLVDVSEVMSRNVATCGENTELTEVIRVMRSRGVRRLPVLDARGNLAGIVAIDDIYGMLSLQMQDLSQAVTRGQVREMSTRVQGAP